MVKLTDELKREIGQHFIFGFHGDTPFSGKGNDILTLTGSEYWVGNVIFMKRNVIGSEEQNGRAQVLASHIAGLQRHARDAGQSIGLSIGTDQEGGLVSAFSAGSVATLFPGAMALASITDNPSQSEPESSEIDIPKKSLEITESVYAAQGSELNFLGVNWVFAPVGDVNSERENPVIGVRSFGDDPERVAQHVLASCRGLTNAGIAPSVKHFPGHGDTSVDSHLGLPRVWKEWANKSDKTGLEDIELVPFRRLTEKMQNDMITIMTGHMALPLVTGKADEPASLSAAVTNGILRDNTKGLGFNGVVVTDCLEMDAISKTKEDLEKLRKAESASKRIDANSGSKDAEWEGGPGIEEGAVLALQAGADVVMICHTFEKQRAAIERVWEAIESGRISLEMLRKSTERIMKWKEALHLRWDQYDRRAPWNGAAWGKLKRQNAQLSSAAYRRTVACLKEGETLSPQGKVVVFTPAMQSYNLAVDDAEGVLRTKGGAVRNTAGASFLSFFETIKARVSRTRHVVFGQQDVESLKVLADEQVIFTLRNADRARWQLQALESVLSSVQERVVILSSSTPYDLVEFKSAHSSPYLHLACGEYTKPALDAVEKVIFGDQTAIGSVPVRISE
ncbi:glycoside hydrolase superfamily [Rhodocollybia butyracea]|uniref:Glycoside hydrolase superfamily n=1 Tax=Rhodocollybia butyracea TaxID=206335 RepID=A0A9P5UBV6_9AGAR|nr:glycoside hydrolase superfamily [Rhodocollybia butyracea]